MSIDTRILYYNYFIVSCTGLDKQNRRCDSQYCTEKCVCLESTGESFPISINYDNTKFIVKK